MILIVFRYSKSSKCQSTLFIPDISIEINFEYCLIDFISFIDISNHLMNSLPLLFNELLTFDTAISSILISSYSCNVMDCTILDFSRFTRVRSIEIGNDCFESVQTFKINGLNRLKTIKIGKNSFTQKKNSWGNDSSKSFHILNCESLEFIEIGKYSFSDFAGKFELKNLPQLQSIQIGSIGSTSNNFNHSSFVIRGIYMIMNIVMIRSSKSTNH